jgi:hypothetical protein
MSAPRRTAGAGLLAAEYCTAPSPWPDGVDVIVSHGASLDADHVHSRAVETVMVPEPPVAATDVAPASDTAQRVLPGLTAVLVDEPQPDAARSAAPASANAGQFEGVCRRACSAVPFTAATHAGASPVSVMARRFAQARKMQLDLWDSTLTSSRRISTMNTTAIAGTLVAAGPDSHQP